MIRSIIHGINSLNKSVRILLYVGFAGQLAFALYIALHFGITAAKGQWQEWTAGMIHGIIEGDLVGNVALVIHIFLAFVITVSGPLQFFSYFRERARTFHKWNGRIYILTALIISVGALFMTWYRPVSIGGNLGRIATSINGAFIIWFAIMTWRTGMQRSIISHRKWAIRTFVAASGVWFFRIGFGTWFMITGFTAPGVEGDLSGWFDRSLYFGSYLLPLSIAEAYIRIKETGSQRSKRIMARVVWILVPLLIGGTVVTTMVFWLG